MSETKERPALGSPKRDKGCRGQGQDPDPGGRTATTAAGGASSRRSGPVAGAGVFALGHMVERLADDHAHAQLLAARLADIPGVALAPPPRPTLAFLTV